MQLAGTMEIRVPLAGFVDVKAEQVRLQKEIDKLQADITKLTSQLANERFVANAPPAVVAKERERLASNHRRLRGVIETAEAEISVAEVLPRDRLVGRDPRRGLLVAERRGVVTPLSQ